MSADKIDLYKLHKDQYKATAKPSIINLPPIPYLVIDGHGSPMDDEFMDGMKALYSMAYALKFMAKEQWRDFVVAKLEGIWYPEGGFDQEIVNPSDMIWQYNLLIRMPEFVKNEDLETVRELLGKKKKEWPFERVALNTIEEGLVVQALHIGPYAEETPTLEKMHAWAQEQGYRKLPHHHEIYLSDPRRVAPSRLRTILRTQVEKM